MTSVLINATSGLGENLLAVPFVRHLRQVFPEATLTLAARFETARCLFERMAPVDRFLALNWKSVGGPPGLAFVLASLRRSRFDYCFNLVPANKAVKNLLARLSGARTVVTHAYDEKPCVHLRFLADRLAPVAPDRHDVEQNFGLLEAIGLTPPGGLDDVNLEVKFPVEDREARSAAEWLSRTGPSSPHPCPPPEGKRREGVGPGGDVSYLGLHAGSSQELGMDAKRWAPERFANVATELRRRAGLVPVVFGGPDEQDLAAGLARACGGFACVGHDVPDLAAILARCRLMVSNDSFPMHLAAAVGVPVVAVFGPTDPARTRPWTSASRVVRVDLDCSPCWNVRHIGRPFRCTHHPPFACIRDVDEQRVLDACLELLA